MGDWWRDRLGDIASNVLWALLLAFVAAVGAVVYAFVTSWAAPLLIPLFFGTFGAVLWAIRNAIDLRSRLGTRSRRALFRLLRDWLDYTGFDVRTEQNSSDGFKFVVTDRASRPVSIFTEPERDDILLVATGLDLDEKTATEVNALVEQHASTVIFDLRLRLTESGLQIAPPGIKHPLGNIDIFTTLQISPELSRAQVIDAISDVIRGVELFRQTIQRAMWQQNPPTLSTQQTSGEEHQ
ncbi:MAG: DUF2299 family protein [Chloroflexi bacterium]|nr:DUF2299 family protein [Chloroflexota bacterium]